MKKKLLTFLATGLFILASVVFASATPLSNIIYSTDFENGITSPPWNNLNRTTDSYGGFNSTNYHGNYSLTGSTTLTLTGLGPHTQLALDFDLYLFSTWDGNNTTYGPDYFSLAQDISGSWTFTNHQSAGQSYNGTPDETYGASGMSQTHVYRDLGPTGADNGFLIAHTGPTFTITFGGPTTQSDEWWGIDNVTVSTNAVPEPTTMLLLGIGIAGLGATRIRCKKN